MLKSFSQMACLKKNVGIFVFLMQIFCYFPIEAQTSTFTNSSKASLPGNSPQSFPTQNPTAPAKPATTTTTPLTPPKANFKTPVHTTREVTESVYTLPGIVGQKDGKWLGSDNLYNLPENIPVVVEVIKPIDQSVPINNNDLRSRVNRILNDNKITSRHEAFLDEPMLPFFHLLLMAIPLEKGNFVVSVSGRLFERITLPRVVLEKGIFWQAITWEKQDLIYATGEQLQAQLIKTVEDIATSFVERYKFFSDLKNQQEGQD
jgi:hypothetical protein